ncbi:Alpha/beta hydrolase [Rickettsiales endosymbiont of Paramecium tredecaurelia]|uniref:alpha/beta fold hydrolase n=1 Tax=Candidatus Sarmatiella mevalonica TaxID=2770581 RepID=UPI001920A4F7|nr:alpha/beta hydrolase [Candidatus Sarmatiella mevalonica]MBL3284817.1 Alpha/beta hydrolase [Candidatus Sarmatiella mevalonica]
MTEVSSEKLIEIQRENFCLKASIDGSGAVAIVIGSYKYYPRTFSKTLRSKLRIVCTDTRGFAAISNTHTEKDFTSDKIVEDIEVIRVSLGVEKIILIGHSIHAFIALEYARAFPKRVTHLVLIASSPTAGAEIYKEADRYFEESVCPQRKSAFAMSMQEFAKSSNQSFVKRLLSFGPRIWYDYNFDASQLWEGVELHAIGAGIIWGSMFVDYDMSSALTAINAPILLALGRYDYFNPPHLWEKYRTFSSDLTIRVFEKSGHTPQLEESDNFDEELMRWLSSH